MSSHWDNTLFTACLFSQGNSLSRVLVCLASFSGSCSVFSLLLCIFTVSVTLPSCLLTSVTIKHLIKSLIQSRFFWLLCCQSDMWVKQSRDTTEKQHQGGKSTCSACVIAMEMSSFGCAHTILNY